MRSLSRSAVDGSSESRLFELSSELLATASLDGCFTLLNPAWQRSLGWSIESMMGQAVTDLAHPDDVDAMTGAVERLGSLPAGSVVEFENRYRAIDGGYCSLEWQVVADSHSWYFVVREIGHRKALE